ncbi:RNase adapter RapZ [Streptomonospora sp. PA3]|uniref:RNase adapter RapZ n=1 Tax=Streptomonospora sp. PA3 TaxID=2607326 RepID=UPI0012DBEAD1|nr:RNase adapter RapZ [Streptomonospora sp. PA3]MUL41440.1 RNase adapter RapZ [Streptomonospora sp. PA3]
MPRFLVIAGLSGAGRSLASDHLEDLGWFAIDNLPIALVPKVAELARGQRPLRRCVLTLGSDAYGDQTLPMLAWLRSQAAEVTLLFLEASNEVLVRRYDQTRRRHPLAEGGDSHHPIAAIERERELYAPLRAAADLVLDTSEVNIHELRRHLSTRFSVSEDGRSMQVTLMSFGYKHGLPLDADLVFDCRFLPNPHWVEELRPMSGLDAPVSEYVLGKRAASAFLTRLDDMLTTLLPAYESEGKTYLTVALGCTGGRHRSVAMVEQVARNLGGRGLRATPIHRDVAK